LKHNNTITIQSKTTSTFFTTINAPNGHKHLIYRYINNFTKMHIKMTHITLKSKHITIMSFMLFFVNMLSSCIFIIVFLIDAFSISFFEHSLHCVSPICVWLSGSEYQSKKLQPQSTSRLCWTQKRNNIIYMLKSTSIWCIIEKLKLIYIIYQYP
jgi:hypothetical protein